MSTYETQKCTNMCDICHQDSGTYFTYYTAEKTGENRYSSTTVTTTVTTYKNLTRHSGYVCEKCCRKTKIKVLFEYVALFILLVGLGLLCVKVSAYLCLLFWASAGILAFLGGAQLFKPAGSEALIRQHKKLFKGKLVYFTPEAAAQLKRK